MHILKQSVPNIPGTRACGSSNCPERSDFEHFLNNRLMKTLTLIIGVFAHVTSKHIFSLKEKKKYLH